MKLKLKVCGLNDPKNIGEVSKLPIDYMGFIFYPPSPRFAGEMNPEVLKVIPKEIDRVGVFVDSPNKEILETAKRYGLTTIQMHGSESVDQCQQLIKEGLKVIKAFAIKETEDFNVVEDYVDKGMRLLFDSKSVQYGGSGKRFDWELMTHYKFNNPFILSGGIGLEDWGEIKEMTIESLCGIDINSKFETSPGTKDIQMIKQFISRL